MSLLIEQSTLNQIGEALGDNFCAGDMAKLSDLLKLSAEGCHYAAEDLADRAGGKSNDYQEEADSYSAAESTLKALAKSIDVAEKAGS